MRAVGMAAKVAVEAMRGGREHREIAITMAKVVAVTVAVIVLAVVFCGSGECGGGSEDSGSGR